MSTDVSHDRLYLGLDLSTQQLKGVVLNDQLETIAEESISFNDRSSLVHHVQPNGFVVDPNDKRCITTPVLVFLEAIGNFSRPNGKSKKKCSFRIFSRFFIQKVERKEKFSTFENRRDFRLGNSCLFFR